MLSYASQPVFENLIVTLRPHGVAITALPHPRYVRMYSLRLAGVLTLALAIVGTTGYLWLVENKEYELTVGISIVVGFLFATPPFLKLLLALRTLSIDADPTGIRFGYPDARWHWLLKSPGEQQIKAEHVVDVVATRVCGRPPVAEHTYFLQLRLRDGRNINLGFGTEVEIQWLTQRIQDALGFSVLPAQAGEDGVIAPENPAGVAEITIPHPQTSLPPPHPHPSAADHISPSAPTGD